MKFVKLKTIRKVKNDKVYHLTVKNNHNFFANNLCVHNCDYLGEVSVLLFNHGHVSYKISEGDRIAQGVLAPVCDQIKFEVVDKITKKETNRGAGGFGHTGQSVLKNLKPVPSTLSVGTSVKVTDVLYGHEFEIGEFVTCIKTNFEKIDETYMHEFENSKGDNWYMSEEEFKIV